MSPRALGRLIAAYVVALVIACIAVNRIIAGTSGALGAIESVWLKGERVARAEGAFAEAPSAPAEATRVREAIVNEGAIFTAFEAVFALSLLPGKDGVKATLDGKTAYVTPDDLLSRQGYDKGVTIAALPLTFGADVPLIEAMLAEQLGVTVPDLRARARMRRIRVERTVLSPAPAHASDEAANITAESLTPETVRAAALDAAYYLARGVSEDGHYRYLVDAPTNRTLSGYDWPRHSGATYFLAQAYGISHDPAIGHACLRASALLRERALLTCGDEDTRCIGDGDVVDLGSSALALVAFVEIARTNLDPGILSTVTRVAKFVRAQQREDGEFMHQYDRHEKHPIDVQFLYYSGEATLALARAHALTHDDALLAAARRGLAHLVGPAWSFFGDRYYFGEEHWTCQAMGDLWDRLTDAERLPALDFCERWNAYNRQMTFGPGETLFDADGAIGVGPILTPRLTPVASRCEAAVATLDAASRAGDRRQIDALDHQLRHALALILRHQLRPGPAYLFADPSAVYGAIPGSLVDLQLRIDYAQHAGSAMIRWLSLSSPAAH